jgi:hypothetical protein
MPIQGQLKILLFEEEQATHPSHVGKSNPGNDLTALLPLEQQACLGFYIFHSI